MNSTNDRESEPIFQDGHTQACRQSLCGTLTVEGGDVHAPSLGETRLAPIRPCRFIWLSRCQAVIFLEVPNPQCVVPASACRKHEE